MEEENDSQAAKCPLHVEKRDVKLGAWCPSVFGESPLEGVGMVSVGMVSVGGEVWHGRNARKEKIG